MAAFYLHHRHSEDLDFFGETDISVLEVTTFVRSLKKSLGYKRMEFQRSFNRNLVFFTFNKQQELKVEFTYFIGSPLEPRKRILGILVDSLLDIAVNKAFTIAQNARTRDFIDLYLILKKQKGWAFPDLLKMARTKFDVYVDPIQIGSQLMRVAEIRDYPRMIQKLKDEEWQGYFLEEAKKLKDSVLKA